MENIYLSRKIRLGLKFLKLVLEVDFGQKMVMSYGRRLDGHQGSSRLFSGSFTILFRLP